MTATERLQAAIRRLEEVRELRRAHERVASDLRRMEVDALVELQAARDEALTSNAPPYAAAGIGGRN